MPASEHHRQQPKFDTAQGYLQQILTNQGKIFTNQRTIMTQLDDLTAAVAQLQTDVSAAAQRVIDTLSAVPAPTNLQPAIDAVKAIDAAVQGIDVTPAPPAA